MLFDILYCVIMFELFIGIFNLQFMVIIVQRGKVLFKVCYLIHCYLWWEVEYSALLYAYGITLAQKYIRACQVSGILNGEDLEQSCTPFNSLSAHTYYIQIHSLDGIHHQLADIYYAVTPYSKVMYSLVLDWCFLSLHLETVLVTTCGSQIYFRLSI